MPDKGRSSRFRPLSWLALAVALIALSAVVSLPTEGTSVTNASTASYPPLSSEEIAQLGELYSPVLAFSAGERTFPVAVEYFIANSRLVGPSGTVLEHLSPADVGALGTEGAFLDHSGGGQRDAGAVTLYEADRDDVRPVVYVRAAEVEGKVLLQYWSFYVFNQGTFNSHEGDWEMMQVILERNGLAPSSLTLSRHHQGDRISWDRLGEEDLSGAHPLVLVAEGSHANYLPSSVMRSPGDRADGRGEALAPGDYDLVRIGQEENGTMSPSWLLFQGSWGEEAPWGDPLGKGGPPGPMYREGGLMWAGLGWGA